MPTQISRIPIRLRFDADVRRPAYDMRTNNAPVSWRGNDVGISVGIFLNNAMLDLTNMASLTLELRSAQSIAAETLLVQKVVNSVSITPTPSSSGWISGAEQHAIFNLSAAEMNLSLGTATDRNFWLILSGLTGGGERLTFGYSWFTISEDGTGDDPGSPPIPPEDFYNKTEIDALLALLAPMASPAFTGAPTAPTPASSEDSSRIATTAFARDLVVGTAAPLIKPYSLAGAAAFAATGANTIQSAIDFVVLVGRQFVSVAALTPIAIDTGALAAGTDYAIYALADGSLVFSASFSAPAGHTSADSQLIGGFHYAPGGNAAAQAGGDGVPAINPYSIWDLKYRPNCPDPRGMALVAGAFWCDIYLCNRNPEVNGSSRYGLTIADGSLPATIPTMFGGNGVTAYATLNWWEAAELATCVGKQLLSYDEACAAFYGVTEATARGTDPVSTGLDSARTSRWGIMQATGNLNTWGRGDNTDPNSTSAAAWQNIAGGRGQLYLYGSNGLKMPLFGGYWGNGAYAGSRYVGWDNAPSVSSGGVGVRARCDHLVLV